MINLSDFKESVYLQRGLIASIDKEDIYEVIDRAIDLESKLCKLNGEYESLKRHSDRLADSNEILISERDELKARLEILNASYLGLVELNDMYKAKLAENYDDIDFCNDVTIAQGNEDFIGSYHFKNVPKELTLEMLKVVKCFVKAGDEYRFYNALLSSVPVTANKAEVPEGWKIVPKILTSKMYDEIVKAANKQDFISWPANCWENALDVAPPPPLKDGE